MARWKPAFVEVYSAIVISWTVRGWMYGESGQCSNRMVDLKERRGGQWLPGGLHLSNISFFLDIRRFLYMLSGVGSKVSHSEPP
jgi:hypothetical protein